MNCTRWVQCFYECSGITPESGEHWRIAVEQKRYVLSGYAVWVTLLIAIYYGFDGLRITAWSLLSLSGVAAIVAGLILNRPARKAPWVLLAAALSCFAAG